MVFAVDPADPQTAFAISTEELTPFVQQAATRRAAISTGSCLSE
jgi:hypothetical protein